MNAEAAPRKFYEMSLEERLEDLARFSNMTAEEVRALAGQPGLTAEQADHMVENAVGVFSLPLGIARTFLVNGREVLAPRAIEEPSVVAGASFMARLARPLGGFRAETTAPEMIGQMQILEVSDPQAARQRLLDARAELLEAAANTDPVLKKYGGGPRDIEVRVLEDTPIGPFLVLHLIYDVSDAMGANAINTTLESLAPLAARISGGRVHLRILSNLADRRLARASAVFRLQDLAFDQFSGEEVRDCIIAAWAFASADPYRASTHNKGIMNGVDAVVIASGNDWRAIEAGAHAYAARSGRYTSLSTWGRDAAGNLTGSVELPMAVGIIGGATRVHPAARAALKLMGVSSAAELAQIIAAVGLAQNLAALRALATEGIQRGHMSLHARQVAAAAGAEGSLVTRIADQMVREQAIRADRAAELLKEYNQREDLR